MDIKMQVRYFSHRFSWLCFSHAMQAAAKGDDVKTEIDDYTSEYYMGPTSCVLCDAAIDTK